MVFFGFSISAARKPARYAREFCVGGFTLIELILVIVITGILAVISLPLFQNYSQAARVASTRGTLGAVRSVVALRYANSATGGSNASYPSSISSTDFVDKNNPRNSLLGGGTSAVVTTSAVPSTTLTNAAGFWYISSGASAGMVGAFTGTGADAIDVSTF